jgi:hypothetical protein
MTIPAIPPPLIFDEGSSGGFVELANVFVAKPTGHEPVGWGSWRIQSDRVELATSYIPATPPVPYPLAELASATISLICEDELTSS